MTSEKIKRLERSVVLYVREHNLNIDPMSILFFIDNLDKQAFSIEKSQFYTTLEKNTYSNHSNDILVACNEQSLRAEEFYDFCKFIFDEIHDKFRY